jgi:hypothetical protein
MSQEHSSQMNNLLFLGGPANSEKEGYFKYVLIAITTYTRGVYMVLEANFDENKSE